MTRITLREAVKEDWPAIVSLHIDHQRKQGTNYELPYLFGPSIALVLVGEDESGAIRNVVYAEAVAEMRFVGCDPRATAFSRREIEGFSYVLRAKGYRFIECFIPRKLKKHIKKPLLRAGFEDKDAELSYFSRELTEKHV